MQFGKTGAFLLCFILIFVLSGCGGVQDSSSEVTLVSAKAEKTREFKLEKFNLKFCTPDDWKEDSTDTELDIYCENDSVGMGIFGYYRSDFADSTNVTEILSEQSKDNMERYTNVQRVEHTPAFSSADKSVTTELYSAEYEGVKIYQYFCYVRFKENDEFFWVTFSARPSYMKKNFNMLEKIIDSFEIYKGGEEK